MDYLKNVPKDFEDMLKDAKELEKAYQKLGKIGKSGTVEKKGCLKQLKKIKKITTKIEESEEYQLILTCIPIADYIIRFLSFIGVSMPSFWFGMLMIWIFAVRCGWLPVAGSSSWKHVIMPTLTLAVGMSCYYIRRIRAVMVEQLSEEYITGCRSRGIGRMKIIFCHVLPNSLLAVVTMLGMSFGGLLGGTMIVETVFSWNGIGQVCTTAISARDYSLIQGYTMWMGFIYVIVNLLVDISYSFIDPRIRRGMSQK